MAQMHILAATKAKQIIQKATITLGKDVIAVTIIAKLIFNIVRRIILFSKILILPNGLI